METPAHRIAVSERFNETVFTSDDLIDSSALDTFRAEDAHLKRRFGPRSNFNTASRVQIGGDGYPAAVGTPRPVDDGTVTARRWMTYFDAEQHLFADTITVVRRYLFVELNLPIPAGENYLPTHWAGCLVCTCTPGYVAPAPIRTKTDGDRLTRPLDIRIAIK